MHLPKAARRIAVGLVLLPKSVRPASGYSEEYLKRVSACRSWSKLQCAYCDCWKKV